MNEPGGNGTDAQRHPYGPRAISGLVAIITRPAFRKRAPAGAQVLADWDAIVGPELAATTAPRRLTRGTLTLSCSGPTALELQHLSEQLMARVNGHVGRVIVERLRFVQDVLPAPAPPPPPKRRRATQAGISGLAPGPLHDALLALGRAVQDTENC